ncbi:hypothetical protein M378DRAFT_171829 [Amanita muscaria Koide BX008]|uniref:Uncharacterized protein n=1 Tax=Amanita muscaria (strain Koide BX008) TaxID=946122 RepID=A0A0C2S3Y4_AMAMK|nr:hypothetical protein M378DRAFT_171829 [Amanita muscaria Koide BX008]
MGHFDDQWKEILLREQSRIWNLSSRQDRIQALLRRSTQRSTQRACADKRQYTTNAHPRIPSFNTSRNQSQPLLPCSMGTHRGFF